MIKRREYETIAPMVTGCCLGITLLEFEFYLKPMQASTLTKKVTGPVGPVTPRIYWSCKKITGPTIFFF